MKGGYKICKIDEDRNCWEEMVKEFLRHLSLRLALCKVYNHIATSCLEASFFHDTDEGDTEMVKRIIESFDDLKQERDCWRTLAVVSIITAVMMFGILMSHLI